MTTTLPFRKSESWPSCIAVAQGTDSDVMYRFSFNRYQAFSGVLKITPSHDNLDWEIARHHWGEIFTVDPTANARSCLEVNGTLNTEAGEFAGLDRFEARTKVNSISF